jgi:diacylglycerol kinase
MSPIRQFIARVRSVQHALAGIWVLLKTQKNARIHACATVVVVGMGCMLRVPVAHWLWLVAAITLVWVTEALNTALEFLGDAVSPEFHPLVKKAKDVAAGAVLIAAMGAAIIGLLTLGPPLLNLIL